MKRIIFSFLVKLTTLFRLKLHLSSPVFIIGIGRSGTTLLADLLSQHSKFAMFPNEANKLWHPAKYPYSENADFNIPFWIDPEGFTNDSIKNYSAHQTLKIKNTFALYYKLTGKKHFLVKSAMICFMVPVLKKLFPQSRFIYMIRDGRSVALSYTKKQFKKIHTPDSNYSKFKNLSEDELLEMMCNLWNKSIEVLKNLEEILPKKDILIVRYEDLCTHPLDTLNNIGEFIDQDKALLNIEVNGIISTNFKTNEVDPDVYEKLTRRMENGLRRFNYI